jgi:hypothetical protein
MLLESLIAAQVYNSNFEIFSNGALGSFAQFNETILVFIIASMYALLFLVALYTSYQCARGFTFTGFFTAFFFPTLYLLIHPNMKLSHVGPKSYCESW